MYLSLDEIPLKITTVSMVTFNKQTMMVLYRSPEQTDLQITIEASANFTALRFLYEFYVQA